MTRRDRKDPTQFKADKLTELRNRYKDAIAAHSDLVDLIVNHVELQADIVKYRDQIDDLEGRIPEGARVLTPEEAKVYEAYVALGKPEEVTQRLTEGDEAKATASKLAREKQLGEAAVELGWNPKAFSRLDQLSGGLQLEVKEEKDKDGRPVKSVLHKGADGKAIPLQEYVQANFEDLLPALTAGSNNQNNQNNQQQNKGFVQQRAGGDKVESDPAGERLKAQQEQAKQQKSFL